MSALPAIVDILSKLSGVGFGVLLLLILYGSYQQIWVWGKDSRDDVEGSEKRRFDELAALRAEREDDRLVCEARLTDVLTRLTELRRERDDLMTLLKNRGTR